MANWRKILSPAGGFPLSRELAAAGEGLTRDERRAANRAIRRGEAARDLRVAALAAARARFTLRLRNTRTTLFFALIVVAWTAIGVSRPLEGDVVLGVVFLGFTAFGLKALWAQRPGTYERLRDAERLNREVAERAGRLAGPPDETPVTYPRTMTLASALVLWTFNDLIFGALTRAMDGHSLELPKIILAGAAFATVMVVVNIALGRSRQERRTRRAL